MPQLSDLDDVSREGLGAVRLRPAEPDDSPFIAQAILHASRGHLERGLWDVAFEIPMEDRLDFLELLALIDARSFCHYSNFLIAEVAGGSVAALSAYDPGEPGLLSPGHAIATAAGEFALSDDELAACFARLESYHAALPEQKEGLWTVEWVWTVPSRRRRGLLTALMERILQLGWQRGYTRAQVTTVIGNAPALRAYERADFRMAEEKRHPAFEALMGAPGLVRYERGLGHRA